MANFHSGGQKYPALWPEERADGAAKRILRHLLETLEYNQAELLSGRDGESLHDFRVAVRRTRCALGQIKQVFPAPRIRRFAAGFAELGRMSSAARDWEVYLQGLDAQAQTVPEPLRAALEPLRAELSRRHRRELRHLLRHLRSADHRRFLAEWRAFLDAPLPRRSSLLHATQPVLVVAGGRIEKVYRRVLKEGEAIEPDSPPQALHELRKTCKKLRYLLEFFQALYPPRRLQRLVGILKALQEELGAYQDSQVQVAALLELAATHKLRRAQPMTLMAMGALLRDVDQRAGQARAGFDRRFALLASAKTRRRFAGLLQVDNAAETD
ncbi:CHAD domain-containing protein [Methylogaea oryzae]|uniref:CHAD domain-containing protein n=1 Tax=Methylogaea oryzae TaxID=1295382 RepID=A0A8D5AJT5_9GAMM|nr:CHAD domain-containing protein [Methylogaea oryzae]BBL72761.1 hypothetical protein MoryE10_33670 [Methylogaea oryzae]